jgi:hypothetical protein
MKKPIKTSIKFKDYSPGQIMLLPPSLEEMIDVNHPVRIVNQVIEKIDLDPLFAKYKGGGHQAPQKTSGGCRTCLWKHKI